VSGFIEELLEASRAAAPLALARSRVDLGELARRVVDDERAELERAGCACAVTERAPAVGRWDAARLAQALRHLLANAAKYAPGRVEVEVDVDVRGHGEGAVASLAVRDRGPGVAPEDRERIFGRFERAVSYRNVSGLGVGLDLVRRVAEAHGGAARVEATPGGGCTFVLALPLEDAGALTRA
jgi:signal transduction histidine kinase